MERMESQRMKLSVWLAQKLFDLGIRDVASCIAIADPALASIAPLAASIIIYARHHPASVESPAMEKASGNGNFTGA